MQQIGELLENKREIMDISVKDVASKTNIGTRYILALEADDFSKFPSETHTLGFIRNYSIFLGLNPEKMLGIYKRQMLQEAPVPIKELTAPHKERLNPAFFITIFSILVFIILLIILLSSGKSNPKTNILTNNGNETNKIAKPIDKQANTVKMNHSKKIVRYVKPGDMIKFRANGQENTVAIEKIVNDSIIIKFMGQRIAFKNGTKKAYDLDNNNYSELTISVNQVSLEKASVEFSTIPEIIRQETATKLADEQKTDDKKADENKTTKTKVQTTTKLKGKAIISSTDKVEINLIIKASGTASVNIIKDEQKRENHFLRKGQEITIRANNSIMITMVNPNNLKLNLNNELLHFGNTIKPTAGFLFKWRRNQTDGKYNLEYEKVK